MDPSAELILAQDGDVRAFGEFVRLTEADVRRFCRWFVGSGHDVDDLVQETYLKAFRGLQTYRAEASARSWLVTVARRVCLDHFENDRRWTASIDAAAAQVRSATHGDGGDDSSAILDLVSRIPSVYGEAFVLVKLFGFTYEEAGRIVNCPRGTIQSRVARARSLLASMVMNSESMKDS